MKICDRCEGRKDVQTEVYIEINQVPLDLQNYKQKIDLCKCCKEALAIEIKRFCEPIPKLAHPAMQREDLK